MSDLDRRPGARMTRKQRQERAYQLTLATGGLAAAAVVTFVLSIVVGISGSIPLIAAVLAVLCFVLLRRTVSGR